MMGLAVLYRFGPSRAQVKWRWVSPGAVLATCLWVAASPGFSIYVRNFGSYTETYGALAGVVILLTWLWISAYVILAGGELNAEIEQQVAEDTTSGAPMDKRAAVKAETRPVVPGPESDVSHPQAKDAAVPPVTPATELSLALALASRAVLRMVRERRKREELGRR